mmetsp:Transcript_10642/g.39717  ORF Transcript_10642/g.39717 Transcript_10642/m.39717 type:complete len:228 (+) Transcript_10642:1810-2493(+)
MFTHTPHTARAMKRTTTVALSTSTHPRSHLHIHLRLSKLDVNMIPLHHSRPSPTTLLFCMLQHHTRLRVKFTLQGPHPIHLNQKHLICRGAHSPTSILLLPPPLRLLPPRTTTLPSQNTTTLTMNSSLSTCRTCASRSWTKYMANRGKTVVNAFASSPHTENMLTGISARSLSRAMMIFDRKNFACSSFACLKKSGSRKSASRCMCVIMPFSLQAPIQDSLKLSEMQ